MINLNRLPSVYSTILVSYNETQVMTYKYYKTKKHHNSLVYIRNKSQFNNRMISHSGVINYEDKTSQIDISSFIYQ